MINGNFLVSRIRHYFFTLRFVQSQMDDTMIREYKIQQIRPTECIQCSHGSAIMIIEF